jgi:hypothetical protein
MLPYIIYVLLIVVVTKSVKASFVFLIKLFIALS